MSNKTSGFKRAIGIVLGVITMLVLICLLYTSDAADEL